MTFLSDELDVLEKNSLRRSLRVISQTEGPRLTLGDRSLLNFSSNNYLGLARHTQVLEAVRQVLEHWGVGATSSRLISGTSIIHRDLEDALAAYLGRPSALLFPTGYMANLGVITSLVGQGDAVVMDRLCHASLVDAVKLSGARLLVYGHADLEAAERALERSKSFRRRLLVTESVFSMDGDFAPLEGLLSLCRRYDAMSLVDDAHALGIWDTKTRGWDIVVGTLSKSLGSQGGFVAGSSELIDTLVNKARSFIFTTGLSPACVAAAHAALSLIQEDPKPREHLQKISARLRDGLRAAGSNTLGSQSQIVPVLLGEASVALECADRLNRAGIFAPAIRPPTVHAGQCRIRFSVTAEHKLEDIDNLLNALTTLIPSSPSPLSREKGEKPSPYLRERAAKPGEGEP
jgi:8-amino-7-oxononanoate synthase